MTPKEGKLDRGHPTQEITEREKEKEISAITNKLRV